jgi:Uma2 family endonuclease
MTGMAEHTSQMSVGEFETIASAAPETVTLEFVNGRIAVKKATDGDHNTIVAWLARRCMRTRPDLDLYQGRGLRMEASDEPRSPRPDPIRAGASPYKP